MLRLCGVYETAINIVRYAWGACASHVDQLSAPHPRIDGNSPSLICGPYRCSSSDREDVLVSTVHVSLIPSFNSLDSKQRHFCFKSAAISDTSGPLRAACSR